MAKKEYQNAIRSKKMIKDALIQLLEEKKSLEKISITDVVQKAGLNRGTFYNHYSSINAVVESIEDDLMADFDDTLKKSFTSDGSRGWSFFIGLTNYFKKYEDRFKAIIGYIPQYIFDDIKQKLLHVLMDNITENYPLAKTNPEFEVSLRMIANGVAGTYLDYFKGVPGLTLTKIQDTNIHIYERILSIYHVDDEDKK